MRSKLRALPFFLLFVPLLALGQDARGPLVVELPAGGYVSFKSEAASIGKPGIAASALKLSGDFKSQASVGGNQLIHRVLADATGGVLFGYDLLIIPELAARKFQVTIKPLDADFESKLRQTIGRSAGSKISTLSQPVTPQTLDDGDALALDLLVNEETGVKIVDVVKVSFERSQLWDVNPSTLPRDFTLDVVEMKLTGHRLLVDGEQVSAGKPVASFSGALIWFYVEGKGRFIFSLAPRAGYDFQKVGIVDDKKIQFTWKGQQFEWLSNAPILPKEGTWNVWVLHDPAYVVFGSAQTAENQPNKLEKWDAAIKAAQAKARRMGKTEDPRTFNNNNETADGPRRFRVMVGGADRIENLWPKQ